MGLSVTVASKTRELGLLCLPASPWRAVTHSVSTHRSLPLTTPRHQDPHQSVARSSPREDDYMDHKSFIEPWNHSRFRLLNQAYRRPSAEPSWSARRAAL